MRDAQFLGGFSSRYGASFPFGIYDSKFRRTYKRLSAKMHPFSFGYLYALALATAYKIALGFCHVTQKLQHHIGYQRTS